jgi:hypothetical protein
MSFCSWVLPKVVGYDDSVLVLILRQGEERGKKYGGPTFLPRRQYQESTVLAAVVFEQACIILQLTGRKTVFIDVLECRHLYILFIAIYVLRTLPFYKRGTVMTRQQLPSA